MSLHPIKILDDVLKEYSDYLRTEFRARDPKLREALENELSAPGFLAQVPFYQAHRPFKNGKKWRELPIDARLARVMEDRSGNDCAYLHQSQAIDELLTYNPAPVVVTTGTGSGKTEAFLLPAIQNAFIDGTLYKKSGLTAILVYPMNALANDQKIRIEKYLEEAGMAGVVRVEQYDRGTSQETRRTMREDPPHILLTNYMMLEYLLVRPADRDNIFANHRCKFLVLDEVHTYRGMLGSNIALLIRRLRAHLARAKQDYFANVSHAEIFKRFPALVPVATSATIKSIDERDLPHEEMVRLRDDAVRHFFSELTGCEKGTIRVFGEELKALEIPEEARYSTLPVAIDNNSITSNDPESIRTALCLLAGASGTTALGEAVRQCRILWDLNQLLISKPMSVPQLVLAIKSSVPERRDTPEDVIEAEVLTALVAGAALPDGTPGGLRLRAHRFVRGGWKFYRCIDPTCGRIYPRGEERCTCGHDTAPLYLCRNCGADYLRFTGEPGVTPLLPDDDERTADEWLLCDPARFEANDTEDDDDSDNSDNGTPPPVQQVNTRSVPGQIRNRPVHQGSIDPFSKHFSDNSEDYSWRVLLAPSRSKCLCCGGTAGSRNVITSVGLGTSAAVKVLSEGLVESLHTANTGKANHDGKERLLIFSDSRQDAAHQARFIYFSSRYDRMRRRVVGLLQEHGELSIQRTVELLGNMAVQTHDNPFTTNLTTWVPPQTRSKIQAWEEAPLLDEIAITSGYRGTIINLGLVGIRYDMLDEYIRSNGQQLAAQLGVTLEQLGYLCRIILDEVRVNGALSRRLLRYHPLNPSAPDELQCADWERRIKQPRGLPLATDGRPLTNIDASRIPTGVTRRNVWRRHGAGGSPPKFERLTKLFLTAFGGNPPGEPEMVAILSFLLDPGMFLMPVELFGARDSIQMLQLNEEYIRLYFLNETNRMRCTVCGEVKAGAPAGYPCSRCHGSLVVWKDASMLQNRAARRIVKTDIVPLVAGEHTAQVTAEAREKLENDFKAGPTVNPMNILACSPTLEMGIDIGGLDAVVMRNVPPRPDNYAQRGGRAGRRSRVGMVVGYTRSTPHDQYFYDRPEEMIAGEVPAPVISLGNRDVLKRHLYAIAFGAAEPGLGGRMADYVETEGPIKADAVSTLIESVKAKTEYAVELALQSWGGDTLERAGLTADHLRGYLSELPARIQNVIDSTSRQVTELRQALDFFAQSLNRQQAGIRAANLVARLLGVQTDRSMHAQEADDRSAGYPLRRFAEFGLLPGYEFPALPASLRLSGEEHEEDPITVVRRFGIAQFQPDAHVYARRKRWKVVGLDTSSPWNPRTDGPSWNYRVCTRCGLKFDADNPRCPRCTMANGGPSYPAYEFAGFRAIRDEVPILDEEDRRAVRNLVTVQPQWDGNVIGRWSFKNGWALRLSSNEEVRWLNEGKLPTADDLQNGNIIHPDAKGYLVCPSCGKILEPPQPQQVPARGRRNTARQATAARNNNGHTETCPLRGNQSHPLAICTSGKQEILRLLVPVPASQSDESTISWGVSLGYALLYGMQHHFMLDANELDFEIEGPWEATSPTTGTYPLISLAFIDVSLGGSGYLSRIAQSFNLVAKRALLHLDHKDCDSACYRCLKAYRNQRYHRQLSWPQIIPALDEQALEAPEARPLQTGDLDDPRPWLEAYSAGVGSPLEMKFLNLFTKYGFNPQKQVPIAPSSGEAPISVADFAVPEKRLAIYIDGAAFHVGLNLRRDRFIRDRLRNGNPPWRVEELRASDLGLGEALVKRLMS